MSPLALGTGSGAGSGVGAGAGAGAGAGVCGVGWWWRRRRCFFFFFFFGCCGWTGAVGVRVADGETPPVLLWPRAEEGSFGLVPPEWVEPALLPGGAVPPLEA